MDIATISLCCQHAGAANHTPDSSHQAAGKSVASKGDAAAAHRGEGHNCVGSNERDDTDGGLGGRSDDAAGSGSDDGTGAGSDNRNSACNVSAAGEAIPNKAEGAVEHAGGQAKHITEAVVANHGAAVGPCDGSDGEKGSRSPDASRSGSNNASKLVGNNGGHNDHRSATAGSRTELGDAQHVQKGFDARIAPGGLDSAPAQQLHQSIMHSVGLFSESSNCLLYTSDAADE